MSEKKNETATVEEAPKGTPRISRVREYMTAKFPDREFPDDEGLETALLEHVKGLDDRVAGNDRANKTIMELVETYPEFAQIIEDVAAGMPVQAAIARQFSPEELTVAEGEPDYDAYRKAAEERTKRLADQRERIAAREQNMARSKTDVDAFFAERGMDEAERQEFVDWVDNTVLANLLDGKVDKGILTKLYQGWKYDEAVAEARETGKIEGRNEQIEARRTAASGVDGLASPGTGGMPGEGGGADKPDFLDEVLDRRNRRKF